MRSQLSRQLNYLNVVLLSLVVFFTPLLFTNLTTEYFDTVKIIFLLVAVSILLLLRALIWVVDGKVTLTRTPLDGPWLIFSLVILLSGIFSPLHETSFIGNLPDLNGSIVTWFLYILLYFLATSSLHSFRQVKLIFYSFLLSTLIISVVSLLSYFGLYLPWNFAHTTSFDLTGSAFSSTALVSLLLSILLLSISLPNKFLSWPLALLIAVIFGIDIALTGTPATYLTSVVGFLLVCFVTRRLWAKSWQDAKALQKVVLMVLPIFVGLIFILLSLIPTSLLHRRQQTFNREVQPDLLTSWQVSVSSFRDSPFLGSGPATYPFDFTLYKPASFNQTPYWQIAFSNATNEFLQTLATLGGFGLLALLFICVVISKFAWSGLKQIKDNHLVATLSISAFLMVILLAFHTATVVVLFSSVVLLAMLMSLHKATSEKIDELTIGIKAASLTNSKLIVGDLLPSILFVIFLLIVLFIFFNPFGQNALKLISADIYHRQALNDASTNGIKTYQELVKAENLNPLADSYRTDMAITNFNLANALVTSKLQSGSSPSAALSDNDKQTTQQLLSQSINEGKAAVTLNPLSSKNWEILASVYRQISGVAQNSLQFSLDAYGHAIERDPLNPTLRLSVGGVYYSIKNYDMAIRFFTDAVNLKPDYANAYYNLSIAFRDKGDLVDADATAQKVLNLIDPKSQDFQVASNYLKDLKNLESSQSAKPQNNVAGAESTTPPAAQENSVLQGKSLPKVLTLPSPSSVATPSAIPVNK